MGKNEKTTNRLSKLGYWTVSPCNLKCLLNQNERDVLDVLFHITDISLNPISDTVIIANSGLNFNQITQAKKNLISLNVITIKGITVRGTLYLINYTLLEAILSDLNDTKSPVERFIKGDNIRVEKGLKAINTNTINTLNRVRKDVDKLDITETGKEVVTTSNYKGHKQKKNNNEAIKLCDELNKKKRDCDCDIMSDKEYTNYIENKQELINNYKITYTTKWEIE
ncbi:MAG: hypothetical protein PHY27_05840 [Parabacteroides sp.]|nr:hypothetical protein [Parabacteroides sp.]